MEESDQLYWDAEIYRETDLLDRALPLYERVLELVPEFYPAWRGKAIVFRQLGRREEALGFARRSIEINPDYADGWRAVGAILRDDQKHEEGLACYQRGLQIDPSDIVLWSNLYNTLVTLGRQEESTAVLGIIQEQIPAYVIKQASRADAKPPLPELVRDISILESIIRFLQEGQLWALFQEFLGITYEELPRGDRYKNLSRAVSCYEAALRVFTESDFPSEWARIQKSLGNGYQKLPGGDRSENLSRAIACYEVALRVYTETGFPDDWARVQNNLGNAYGDLQRGNLAENLGNAIACYEAALRVYTEQDFPSEWATTLGNLGNTYQDSPRGNHSANLGRAISCYEAALRVYTEKDFPSEWAGVQNNLGNVYAKLQRGDRTDNVRRAISCYAAALRVYTEKDFPSEWATTLGNLGNSYTILPRGDRARNISRAISCHEAAMRAYTANGSPADWAKTQINLGNTYYDSQIGDSTENLNRAISCYEAALRICSEKNFPILQAVAQNNLGSAYAMLPDDEGKNLIRAIACHEAALGIYNERDMPFDWAKTQHSLGIEYQQLPSGDRRENLRRAIACYEAALRVYTPESFPIECRRVFDNLGDLYFNENDHDRALYTLLSSINVMEGMRVEALEDVEKGRIRFTSELTFERALLSAVRTQKYSAAFIIVELGKTRNLADRLWQLDQRPARVSPEDWAQYQEQLAQAAQIERQVNPVVGNVAPHGDPTQWRSIADNSGQKGQDQLTMLEDMSRIRQEIRRMEHQFAEADPDYTPFAKPLEISEILALAHDNNAVIVNFRVCSPGSYVFLAGPSDSDVSREQTVELSHLSDDVLVGLVAEWLLTHNRSHGSGSTWESYIARASFRIYDEIFRSVHTRIRELYPDLKRLILIPSGLLSLLPLHAAQWESSGKIKCLIDEYEIVYAPSCQVLQRCMARQRERPATATSLLAVQNPDGSLPFSDWEVEEAARHFPVDRRIVLHGKQATSDRVRESLQFGEEKLFSCHGHFDLREVHNSHLVLHGGGRLSLSTVVPASLRGTWLVMLSACVSGLSDTFNRQDEYQGLPAAFLLGGAQTVISTMFSVNDLSTAMLSQRFHENLYERKMAKAPALREAQLWLRDLSIDEADALLKSRQQFATGTHSRFRSLWEAVTQRMSIHDSVAARFDLRERETQHPFANPAHWAGFYCVGAGW